MQISASIPSLVLLAPTSMQHDTRTTQYCHWSPGHWLPRRFRQHCCPLKRTSVLLYICGCMCFGIMTPPLYGFKLYVFPSSKLCRIYMHTSHEAKSWSFKLFMTEDRPTVLVMWLYEVLEPVLTCPSGQDPDQFESLYWKSRTLFFKPVSERS